MPDTIRTIPSLQALLSDGAAAHSTNRQLIRDLLVSLDATGEMYALRSGLLFNGTDETASFLSLLAALYTAGGGTLYLPSNKTLRCDGQILIPNDGGAGAPVQPSMRITGAGASTSAGGTYAPYGGPKLDLRYDGGVAKILTLGHGSLELDHLTLTDLSTNTTTPFFQTTNTTVHIHHNRVEGNSGKSGITCDQDAFLLGGVTTVLDGSVNAKFDGYVSAVHDNCFSRIRRGVYGQKASNAITVRENWFLHNCGSNLPDGAAIEFLGGGGKTCSGNNIVFNQIEVAAYPYGIKLDEAVHNLIVGNGMFDPTVTHLAAVRMGATARYNHIIEGFRDDSYPGLSDASGGQNTFETSHQSQVSIYPQPQKWTNQASKFANSNAYGPVTEDTSGNQWWPRIVTAGTGEKFYLDYKASGGSLEDRFYFWRVDANTGQVFLLGSGNHAIKSDSGSILIDSLTAGKKVTIGNTAAGILGTTLAGFYGSNGVAKPTITGIRSGNAGLQALLAGLASMAQIVNSTTTGGTAIAYSTSMTIDSSTTDIATITATDGVAFTIQAPTNPVAQARLRVRIRNASGGALGAATWHGAFKLAAWTQPANGFSRTIDFDYDGTSWIEAHRTATDVPN